MQKGVKNILTISTVSKILIKVEELYKIFGRKPLSVLDAVQKGESKKEILSKTGHTVALRDINIDIERGTIFVIMGLSGSGKSTLIRHFNRLIDPTSGSITVDNLNVLDLDQKGIETLRRCKMSMVFQRFGLLPHRTVAENIAYGLLIQNITKALRQNKANEWLKIVGLEGYGEQYPSQLSGGQQQRVGLARALCTDPEILLMDEPFSALDPIIRSDMQDQLIELQNKLNKTIIFITHDLAEALRIGDKIAILKDGEICQIGKPEEVVLNPANTYIQEFVNSVNSVGVLSVKSIMGPPKNKLKGKKIGECLKEIRSSKSGYGYLFEDGCYLGLLTEQSLHRATRNDNPNGSAHRIAQMGNTVSSDTTLMDALSAVLKAENPLPVIDKAGRLQGTLSKRNVIDVLTKLRNG